MALMTLDHRFAQLEKLRSDIALVLFPIQYTVDLPLTGFRWISDNFTSYKTLLQENKKLGQEVVKLRARSIKYTALEAENMRLRQLLDSPVRLADRVLVAEVLHVEADLLKRQIVINKGTADQTFIGQTVINAYGIVGQIIHTSRYTSTVMLITSPDHSIPVQIERNGIQSIAVGSQEDYQLKLPYLTTNADVRVGDRLIASGLGSRFPYGYPVAEISRVEQDDAASFSNVYATPTANLDRHREVLLVWSASDEQARDKDTGLSPDSVQELGQ